MFVLFNTDTQEYEEFSRTQLFEFMNADRGPEWSDYDENSTVKQIEQGINYFCAPYQIKKEM